MTIDATALVALRVRAAHPITVTNPALSATLETAAPLAASQSGCPRSTRSVRRHFDHGRVQARPRRFLSLLARHRLLPLTFALRNCPLLPSHSGLPAFCAHPCHSRTWHKRGQAVLYYRRPGRRLTPLP